MDSPDTSPLALAPLMTRPAPLPPGRPWSARAWDVLMTYLPLLMMGLLAAFTWWLVRNTPVPQAERAVAPAQHVPDYEMSGFSLQHFTTAGAARNVLRGERMRHYPDTQSYEVDQVRIDWTDDAGQRTEATALRANANQSGSKIELLGTARVLRQPLPDAPEGSRAALPIEIRGEHLFIDTDADLVSADKPVVLTQGASEVSADTLRYDHRSRVLDLQGRVRGVLAAAGAVPARP